ncbi:MAG TPA: deoxyribodipyrimidine photolyase [Candidatus Dormibacteraeota bacterium]|nr:deoxyribodipyrimidine photolyase [Candidatus Dormibacteraeota bacterium]
MSPVPAIRIRDCNRAPLRPAAGYILYWMIASRRLAHNFALDRAIEHCHSFAKPLLILEALRCDYPWASDRLHRFVLDGMADNARNCERHRILYYPYIEPAPGAASGLLETLAADACAVIADDFPCFFLPNMVAAAAKKLSVRLEAVDSNGLLPLRATDQVFSRAFDFRRFLQKALPAHLSEFPRADPLAKPLPVPPSLPKLITAKWPSASAALLAAEPAALRTLPIDHHVSPAELRGGYKNARKQMRNFLDRKFPDYSGNRNDPEVDATSCLSPYLHFGHISVHEVFGALAALELWNPQKLALRANGSRQGWWNMSPTAESFLDQLITWREVGYNFCSHRQDYDQFASLPEWAQKTLKKHARDTRQHLYSLEQFEFAKTHDPLWNAAQTQIVREGRMHNYLRMLWGKKILEWSPSPQEAASTTIHLNNKYGLDGRDPNSYSGIFWVLGRYDRPWGPERPIFGTIRYMSSENTARKLSVKNYVRKYTGDSQPHLAFSDPKPMHPSAGSSSSEG